MCNKNGESVDHLLLHCEIIGALWNTIFNSLELAWVMPGSVVDFFACWRAPGDRFQLDAVWKMIPLALCDAYRGKETIVALRTIRGYYWNFFFFLSYDIIGIKCFIL